jgi:hypothetical protein
LAVLLIAAVTGRRAAVQGFSGRGVIPLFSREALSHPHNAPPETESAVGDDSQFFAIAALIYPNLPQSLPRQ